jgi:DNA replication protein DnaC
MSNQTEDDNTFSRLLAKLEAEAPEQRAERDRRDAELLAERDQRARRSYATLHMHPGGFPAPLVEAAFELDAGDARDTPAMVRARAFRDVDVPAGRTLLVLSGGVGCGKTTAAAWVVATQRFHQPRFMRAATFARTSRYDAAASSAWSRAGALVLDDLGAEYVDAKGSFLVDFDELLDTYYADRRPLIITTNLGTEDFRDRYGGRDGRIASRIREAGAWVNCSGPDLRRTD